MREGKRLCACLRRQPLNRLTDGPVLNCHPLSDNPCYVHGSRPLSIGRVRHMQKIAHSVFSDEPESREAGLAAAKALIHELGGTAPKAVMAYATMNHDHAALLEGV